MRIIIAKHPPAHCGLCGRMLVELITSKLADGYLVCNYECACGHKFTERYRYATQIEADPVEIPRTDPYFPPTSLDYLTQTLRETSLADKAKHLMELKYDDWL